MRQQPEELNRAFITPFDETDFLWARELLVARRPHDGVPERPSGERGELYRIVTLDALLDPELQANSRIVAGLRYPPMQRKELLGVDEDSLQLEQASWQTCLAQDCVRRKA